MDTKPLPTREEEARIAELLEKRSQVVRKMRQLREEMEKLSDEANRYKQEIETITAKYE